MTQGHCYHPYLPNNPKVNVRKHFPTNQIGELYLSFMRLIKRSVRFSVISLLLQSVVGMQSSAENDPAVSEELPGLINSPFTETRTHTSADGCLVL